MSRIQIALIQMHCSRDPGENLSHALAQIRHAARNGAQLICLPELFRTRYFCQQEDPGRFALAETIPGPTTTQIAALCREMGVFVLTPIFEKRARGVYHNAATLIDPKGQCQGTYRKMHIPDDPHYYEKFYFAPGDLGFRTYKVKNLRISPMICWDQWFPEAARLASLHGANVLIYPTAIGWIQGESDEENRAQLDAWQTIQRAHAIANGVYVAAVNRIGPEGRLTFWGHSFICDPFGRILKQASAHNEEILTAECDLSHIDAVRQAWPFFRDRRIDSYHGLSSRWIDDEAPAEKPGTHPCADTA